MRPPSLAPAYAALFPILVDVAREKGYALALHGSMQRDLDLVAVPWIDAAVGPRELVGALADCMKWQGPPSDDRVRGPVNKPHGRLGWIIQLDHGAYIDLSVMPCNAPAAPVVAPVPGPEATP